MKRSIYTLVVLVVAIAGTAFGQTEVYLNAGSGTEAVFNGQAHLGDANYPAYYNGGTSYTNDTYNPETLFDSEAYSTDEAGILSYEFPVQNGSYTVTTYHNELWFGKEGRTEGPGLRVFDIRMEGTLKKDDYDIYVSNNNNPESLTFTGISVSDGQLTIDIDASVQHATLHGIAIEGEGALAGTNYYYNTGSENDLDHQGTLFLSEHKTGHNSLKTFSYSGASSEPLFQTERFANATIDTLSYKIEVPNGTYTVQTHHNELYFGKHPHAIQNNLPSAQGNRVFDIMIEGSLLVDDFDLFDHGDSDYTHTFTSITVSDGILNIDLPSQTNNATLSGIAIEQTDGSTTAYYNCGGADVSYNGHVYTDDAKAFISSNSNYAHEYIVPVEPLLTTERYSDTGTLDYTIPLASGIYTVQLHHNELFFGKRSWAPSAEPGRRVFDISLEGQLVKDDFDIYTESYNYPTTLTFTGVMVIDGILDINMVSSADHPQLSGITITQETPYNVPALSQNQNYIFTRTYQKEVTTFDPTTVTDHDIMEQVTYYDGLGRPKQQIALEATKKYVEISNFPSVSAWQNDWTTGSGSTAFYNQNGHTFENERIEGTDPYGNESTLWRCMDNDTISSGDGGWNTDYINVDKTKTYRYTTWIKKTSSHDGNSYHGTQHVNNLDGSANNNPYFWTGDLPQLDTWYLLVGVVHPDGYTGGDSGISGVYDLSGNKVMDGAEYTWRSDTSTSRFRNYLFYVTDPNVRQYFYGPVLQILDGTENTLDEIIGSDHSLKDLVIHIDYDAFGRQDKQWLPYQAATGGPGSYRGDVSSITKDFYSEHYPDDFTGVTSGEENPYSQTQFEASPLNRPLKQAAPGKDWKLGNNNEIEFDYVASSIDEVREFQVEFLSDDPEQPVLKHIGYYEVEKLFKNITRDENNQGSIRIRSTEEFKDKRGRVVLKRMVNDISSVTSAGDHDTYYVYDKYSNLSFVLPPKAVEKMETISFDDQNALFTDILNELCYRYIYDFKNRLIKKKIPGKGWEYIIYNTLDQPILTQDAEMRKDTSWIYTKYDILGRVVQTGIYKHTEPTTQQEMVTAYSDYYQTTATTATVYEAKNTDPLTHYYSNQSFPVTGLEEHTLNYYDNYSFDLAGHSIPAVNAFNLAIENHDNSSIRTQGLATGSKVRVLTTNSWITTLMGYDKKARLIYSINDNPYLGTADINENNIDFAGRVLVSKNTHSKNGVDIVTLDNMTYDHYSRLESQNQELNNEIEQLAVNTYDNLGQLAQKKTGNTLESPLQTVDYEYNVRGWLKGINEVDNLGNDLFSFSVSYNTPTLRMGSVPLYNGNISETHWKTANDNIKRSYQYQYDPLNRITSALSNDNNYNLSYVTYDKNGNIMTLKRHGWQDSSSYWDMDVLTYEYNLNNLGNKHIKVTDSGNVAYGFKDGANQAVEYTYDTDATGDGNGNLTSDANKGITSIVYNHLNLPTQVVIANSEHNGTIDFVYDARGVKLRKNVNENGNTTTTDYNNGYIYMNDVLTQFDTSEGYIELIGNGEYHYVYQFKDQVNSVRLSYSDYDNDEVIDVVRNNVDIDGDGDMQSEIIQERNYYPFGMVQKGYNVTINGVENDLKTFQDQEFTKDLGLNSHEWKFRVSDPIIGRFWQIDPLSEKYHWMTTYQFSSNQPIHAPELEGKENRFDLNSQDMGLNLYKMTKQERKQFLEESKPIAAVGGGVMVVATGGFMIYAIGPQAVGTFLLNEVKDEALSQLTGGVSDVIDITKNIKNLAEIGIKKLDIGGGANSKYSDAINIDPNAESGFKGTLSDFAEAAEGTKFSEIVVDNPRFDFLGDATKLLEDGGTITVRGSMNNGFFSKLVNGKADGLDGFNVSNPIKVSNKGFTHSDGVTPVKAQMFEITLTRK